MRYAVFADVHGNLEALRALLARLRLYHVRAYLFVGDAVGYGPDPEPCIRELMDLPNLTAVAGNHDRAAAGKKNLAWFNAEAREAVLWTARRMDSQTLSWLGALPETAVAGGCARLAHGSPADPINEYLKTAQDCLRALAFFSERLCFVGHTHVPAVFERRADGSSRFFEMAVFDQKETFRLVPGARYIVNVGSVGQPRDGDTRACGVVWDTEDETVTFHRASYAVADVQRKVLAAGLPATLSQRLAIGV